jgi:N-acyl-D-amino-acid deacylase
MERMKSLVDRAMEDGAVGLSTGLIYTPGTFAKTEEIVELAKVASAHGGIYASHMRAETVKIFDAIEVLLTVAREAKIRAELSHIKLSGPTAWGKTAEVLSLLDKARASGIESRMINTPTRRRAQVSSSSFRTRRSMADVPPFSHDSRTRPRKPRSWRI